MVPTRSPAQSPHEISNDGAAADCAGGGSMRSGAFDGVARSSGNRESLPPASALPLQESLTKSGAPSPLADRVPWDCAGAREIGFTIPKRYNASEVLFQNLAAGRGERLAVIGPGGAHSYAQLAADAGRWGNAFLALGLSRGDRILLVLDDTRSIWQRFSAPCARALCRS